MKCVTLSNNWIQYVYRCSIGPISNISFVSRFFYDYRIKSKITFFEMEFFILSTYFAFHISAHARNNVNILKRTTILFSVCIHHWNCKWMIYELFNFNPRERERVEMKIFQRNANIMQSFNMLYPLCLFVRIKSFFSLLFRL